MVPSDGVRLSLMVLVFDTALTMHLNVVSNPSGKSRRCLQVICRCVPSGIELPKSPDIDSVCDRYSLPLICSTTSTPELLSSFVPVRSYSIDMWVLEKCV